MTPLIFVTLHVNGMPAPFRIDRIDAILPIPPDNARWQDVERKPEAVASTLLFESGAMQQVDERPNAVLEAMLGAILKEKSRDDTDA